MQQRLRAFAERQQQAQCALRQCRCHVTQPAGKVGRGRHRRHLIAHALLAGRDGNRLPALYLFIGPVALELEHTALSRQRGDAGSAQLGGFFQQPVHALIGGNTGQQVHGARCLALNGAVGGNAHADIAAAHAGDDGVKLAAGKARASLAFEQGNGVARLMAQHLHMARSASGQIQLIAEA